MKDKRFVIYLNVLLLVQIVFVQIVSQYPAFIEQYYSNGLYPFTSSLLRILFGWIPFSIGDIFIAIFVFLFSRFIYKLFKTRFKKCWFKLLTLTAYLSIIYLCFYWFWGFNYFREPLAKNLGFEQKKYTTEQLTKVSKSIVKKLNETHLHIAKNDTLLIENPYTQHKMYKMAVEGYDNLSKKYPQLHYQYASVKSSLMSLLQTYNGTSGYLNPLTGEAQVNDMIPKTGYPTTVCHEMAHQIGFAAENEANFVGYLAALSNDDIYFKYSAYRMAFGYLISELRRHDKEVYKEVLSTVNKGVLKDYRASSEFWSRYENPIEPLLKKGYNSYLKANNQAKGIQSYNYVVDLIISYQEKSAHPNS